jgi:undecaprenyl-diphosphatase
MNWFDFTILRFLTSFANASPSFDRLTNFLLHFDLVKGVVVMALFWAAWFGRGADERRRQVLLSTLVAAGLALFVTMALAMLLPFRLRPVLTFQSPGTEVPPSWQEWSAFPSDHATLFFALATGFFRVAAPLGWVAALHALIVVSLPRVYLGLHYPTDILAGAAIGVVMTYFLTTTEMRRRISAWPLAQMKRTPASFYALLFVLSYLIATLFVDLRRSGTALYLYLTQ